MKKYSIRHSPLLFCSWVSAPWMETPGRSPACFRERKSARSRERERGAVESLWETWRGRWGIWWARVFLSAQSLCSEPGSEPEAEPEPEPKMRLAQGNLLLFLFSIIIIFFYFSIIAPRTISFTVSFSILISLIFPFSILFYYYYKSSSPRFSCWFTLVPLM